MRTLTKKPLIVFSITLTLLLFLSTVQASPLYYYQLKIFHFKTTVQEDRLDKYFQNAYIPAMHRAGFPDIGVFKPIEQDTDKRIYVFIPFKSWGQMELADEELANDKTYVIDGSDYINAVFNDYPYYRIETIILRAFVKMPKPSVPNLTANKTDRIYELRSYENPSEKAGLSKLKMLNEGGEMDLFQSLGFNPVFYGKVIAGSRMPNIMYMTTFNNKQDREDHWNTFADKPEWKTMVAKAEYQHNLNKADKWFLHPTSYSDF